MKRAIFLIVIMILSPSLVVSQITFPAAGGEAIGMGGSVSFTIGQLFYHGH
jgi:hypothetical protein